MDQVNVAQLFVRVVETSSFSKAAAEFGITQPTATKAVAATETRLGVRLLHRSTRGVTPTEIGALYYDKCKQIQRAVDEAEDLAALRQGSVGGKIRISTSVGAFTLYVNAVTVNFSPFFAVKRKWSRSFFSVKRAEIPHGTVILLAVAMSLFGSCSVSCGTLLTSTGTGQPASPSPVFGVA